MDAWWPFIKVSDGRKVPQFGKILSTRDNAGIARHEIGAFAE
jgi:hypothetical protein